jgi:hypothetical protein
MSYTVTLHTQQANTPLIINGLSKKRLRQWVDSWFKDEQATAINIEKENDE